MLLKFYADSNCHGNQHKFIQTSSSHGRDKLFFKEMTIQMFKTSMRIKMQN